MARYRVASTHPEDIAAGAVFGPGELAVRVDPKNPYDKAKIEAGILVPVSAPKKKTPETPEEDK